MAVIEIAKIQVRRGQEYVTGLPQLDSGEFGWALDTQKLYIGNGNLDEGAPAVGNTEIITERNLPNLFALPTYSFQGHSASAPAVTDPGGSGYYYRTIQSKLDDFVTIYDFKGVSDGIALNAVTLQQAINQLYLNADKTQPRSRVALRLPAGEYLIENTIYLPPYTTLLGDGKQKTVLIMTTTSKALIQFCDQSSVPGSYVKFVDGQTYIQSNTHPTGINLIGITFRYSASIGITATLPLVYADCATDSYIIDCSFNGSYPTGISATSNNNYSAINIRGQGALTTRDLFISNCTFDGLYQGITSNYDTVDVYIENCRFRNLNRGIVYSEVIAIGNTVGPIRTKVSNNKFETIEGEAWYVGANTSSIPTNHLSSYNKFSEVGNAVNGDSSQVTSIVNFLTLGNSSVGDYSTRFEHVNSTSTSMTFVQPIAGSAFIDATAMHSKSITLTASPIVLAKFPFNGTDQLTKVQYSLFQSNTGLARKGEIALNVAKVGYGSTSTITDSYSFTGPSDGGVVFSVALNTTTNVVSLGYTSNSADGIIKYKFSQLQ